MVGGGIHLYGNRDYWWNATRQTKQRTKAVGHACTASVWSNCSEKNLVCGDAPQIESLTSAEIETTRMHDTEREIADFMTDTNGLEPFSQPRYVLDIKYPKICYYKFVI